LTAIENKLPIFRNYKNKNLFGKEESKMNIQQNIGILIIYDWVQKGF